MSLSFEYSFGYRHVKNSLAFYDENTVLFTAGKLCILLDLKSGHQKCFQLVEREEISAIVRNDNYILAAIRQRPASVCVFQIVSETRKLYCGPPDMKSQEFTILSLSQSRQFVAGQSAAPDWMLVIWLYSTREVFAVLFPCADTCTVHDMSFSPCGSNELVVVGSGVFKLYEYQNGTDEEFVQYTFEQYEGLNHYYSMAWPQNENLAVGTSDGQLLFFRGIEIIHNMSVSNDVKRLERFDSLETNSSKDVSSVHVTPEVLICLFSGTVVLVYRGEEITHYSLYSYVLLPREEILDCEDYLTSLILSPDGNTLAATTRQGQLVCCNEVANVARPREFSCLLKRQHSEPIIDIDTAICRPLVASCSQYVVCLWNYKTKKQELRKRLKDEMLSLALHPSGLFVALSFGHSCCTFSILRNDLKGRQNISSQNCSRVKFSSAGHLLAVARTSVVDIYSFNTRERMFRLDGHAGPVTCMHWARHDSLLVSCDSRGVVCEWDVVTASKNWENTSVLPYVSVTTDHGGNAVAVGSNKTVCCLKRGLVEWRIETERELTGIVFHSEAFFCGTADGSLLSYAFPSPEERTVLYAHSGRVTAVNVSQDMLASAADDNLVFLSRITYEGERVDIFSDLSLVSSLQLQQRQDRLKQIRLSLEYKDNVYACKNQVRLRGHIVTSIRIALDNQQVVKALNERIFLIKEEIQNRLLTKGSPTVEAETEKRLHREVVDATVRIGEAYARSKSHANQNEELKQNYTAAIEALNMKLAKLASDKQNNAEKMAEIVKDLENTFLLREQEVVDKKRLFSSGGYPQAVEKKVSEGNGNTNIAIEKALHREKLRSAQLVADKKKLKQLISFRIDETEKRRSLCTGQVDHDIREKMNAVTSLKEDFQRVESLLRAKEKLVQAQEKKFCHMRTLVSHLRKSVGVSKMAFEELTERIHAKDSQLDQYRRGIKTAEESFPTLEKELELSQGLCSTVMEKIRETDEGLQKKLKDLRETRETLSKYTSTLHRCLSREYDLKKLVSEITKLFEDSRIAFAEEALDPRLLREYEFQVEKLKQAYDLVREEPTRAMADKAMAELRLSQENSRILRQVHDVQKEDERLCATLNAMEGALLLQMTTRGKEGEGTRGKIEFVVRMSKKRTLCTLEKLDRFIEEQQEEISRFQGMMATR